MAGFSNEYERLITRLIFNAKAMTDIAASAGTTDLWVSLHESDPGDTGKQGNGEVASTTYTEYLRVQVMRTTTGFTAETTQGNASPVENIDFAQHTATSTGTLTHAAIGVTSATTDADYIAAGALSPTINLSQNVTPRITTGSSFTLD